MGIKVLDLKFFILKSENIFKNDADEYFEFSSAIIMAKILSLQNCRVWKLNFIFYIKTTFNMKFSVHEDRYLEIYC